MQLAKEVSIPNYQIGKIVVDDKQNENGVLIITVDTLDNFGNLLIDGASYVPVRLTVPTESEEIVDQFTNALSSYAETADFTYFKKLVKLYRKFLL